jgi:hypothetical protein
MLVYDDKLEIEKLLNELYAIEPTMKKYIQKPIFVQKRPTWKNSWTAKK